MTEDLLTALDVTNKVFRRNLRGYDVAEVDEFLDLVSDTVHIYAERVREQEGAMAGLKEQIQEYQNLRESMQEALIMAQKSAEERIAAAEQQAAAIVEDARSKAEHIQQQANNDAEGIRREMKMLRERRSAMLGELRGLLVRFGALLEHEAETEALSEAPAGFSSSSAKSFSENYPSPPAAEVSETGDALRIPPRIS